MKCNFNRTHVKKAAEDVRGFQLGNRQGVRSALYGAFKVLSYHNLVVRDGEPMEDFAEEMH